MYWYAQTVRQHRTGAFLSHSGAAVINWTETMKTWPSNPTVIFYFGAYQFPSKGIRAYSSISDIDNSLCLFTTCGATSIQFVHGCERHQLKMSLFVNLFPNKNERKTYGELNLGARCRQRPAARQVHVLCSTFRVTGCSWTVSYDRYNRHTDT